MPSQEESTGSRFILARDAAQVGSSDGYACPLDGRLHSRLLRSASQARSGSRCSSAATRRFQAEADPLQTASPRSLLLDCVRRPSSTIAFRIRVWERSAAGRPPVIASGCLSYWPLSISSKVLTVGSPT